MRIFETTPTSSMCRAHINIVYVALWLQCMSTWALSIIGEISDDQSLVVSDIEDPSNIVFKGGQHLYKPSSWRWAAGNFIRLASGCLYVTH